MKIATLVTSFILIVAGLFFLDAGPANSEACYFWEDGEKAIVENCSEIRVTGHSQGNHELDCTVIRPWNDDDSPDSRDVPYPVIAWANGWDPGEIVGENTTEGYKPGLIEWALDGPYLVIAANQWSVQESDVLACLQWVIDQNDPSTAEESDESEYIGVVDTTKLGLAGHSQGGGAVIKAGDGWTSGRDITAVVAMNPYGPAWVNSGNQDGPVMLIGGNFDTTTPPDSYDAVWQAIQANEYGGINAVLDVGTHNSEAWGEDQDGVTLDYIGAREKNFGEYQEVTKLWWDYHLNDTGRSGRQLQQLLDRDPWDTRYAFTDNFEL